MNLVIFRPQCIDSGYLVSATPHTIIYWSFWNFVRVFSMVWSCACGLDVILTLIFVTFSTLGTLSFSDFRFYESCESWYLVSTTPHTILYWSFWNFAHNFSMVWRWCPCINFCHFFHFGNFVIFWPQILWKCCDSGYVVSATSHTILYQSFWNFAHVFPMVWRCACGLDIILELIFATFSTLWTLSFSDLRFCESV